MRLCFGTFATILNHCRQNTTQADFIAKIMNIVDPDRYKGKDIVGDGPAISKLLSCKINFAFSKGTADILSLDTVIERFETDISPFIDEDKKAKVIITLLNLIKNDTCIDSEKKESFIKYFGLEKQDLLWQSSFVFSDLLGRALLYTLFSNIDNQVGNEYVKAITDAYINNVVEPYAHELQWVGSEQTLTLLHVQMIQTFWNALDQNDLSDILYIDNFSAIMNFDWQKVQCDFMNYIEEHIITPFGQEGSSWTFHQILDFIGIFEDYTNDLIGYIFLQQSPPPDYILQAENELPQATSTFKEKLRGNRNQLIDILNKLCDHVQNA